MDKIDVESRVVKECPRCGQIKSASAFHRAAGSPDGLQNWCKDCKKRFLYEWRATNAERVRRQVYAANLRRNYGLTLEHYDALFHAQGGVCAICLSPETVKNRDGTIRRLHVDHDHKTGEIRGLLCSACNSVLGYMEARPRRVAAAVRYLRAWRLGKSESSHASETQAELF